MSIIRENPVIWNGNSLGINFDRNFCSLLIFWESNMEQMIETKKEFAVFAEKNHVILSVAALIGMTFSKII